MLLGLAALAVIGLTWWQVTATHGVARLEAMPSNLLIRLSWQPVASAAALAGIALTLLVAARMRGAVAGWFRYLGRQSMAIYLLHIMAAAGTRIILVKAFGVQDTDLILFAAVAVGIAAPLVAAGIARRLGLSRLLAL